MLTNRDIFQSVYTGQTQASDGLFLSAWWEHSCLDAPCYFCPHFSTWMNWYLQRLITQTSAVSHMPVDWSQWVKQSEIMKQGLWTNLLQAVFPAVFGSHHQPCFFFKGLVLKLALQMDFMEYFKELCSRLIGKKKNSSFCHYSPKFPDELVDSTRVGH